MYNVVPGILNIKKDDVLNNISKVINYSNLIQIDVCDGEYVQSLTWLPNQEAILPTVIGKKYEFDLMVLDTIKYIKIAADIGACNVIIHSNNQEEIIKAIEIARGLNLKVGLTSSIDNIRSFVSHIDYIQIMGIDNIGKQGQRVRDNLIKDIIECEYVCSISSNKNIYIQVDGGMNLNTISDLVKNREFKYLKSFVVGSAIFNLDNTEDIKSLINKIEAI